MGILTVPNVANQPMGGLLVMSYLEITGNLPDLICSQQKG